MNKDIDELLEKSLVPTDEPSHSLNKKILSQFEQQKMTSASNWYGVRRMAIIIGMVVILLATGASISYAVHKHFFVTPIEYGQSKGVKVDVSLEKNQNDKQMDKNAIYYLQLDYIPEGYKWDTEGSIYVGKDKDTDFWSIAYFHLQSEFFNILPQSKNIEKIKTNHGEAYLLKSDYENRLYIRFTEADYLLEIRDRNRKLNDNEIKKIAQNARINCKKQKGSLYETIEWTQEMENSYKNWLKQYED